jgi:hypothetical protein
MRSAKALSANYHAPDRVSTLNGSWHGISFKVGIK